MSDNTTDKKQRGTLSSNPGCPCGNNCQKCADEKKTTKNNGKEKEEYPPIPTNAYVCSQPT